MSNSLQHHGLKPTRLFCSWDFPGKNTGVGSHSLLQTSSRPQNWTPVSWISIRFFTIWVMISITIKCLNASCLDYSLAYNEVSKSWLLCLWFMSSFHLCWPFPPPALVSPLAMALRSHTSPQTPSLYLILDLNSSTADQFGDSFYWGHHMACGIFPNQGLNPCPMQWKCIILTTRPPGKSKGFLRRRNLLIQS